MSLEAGDTAILSDTSNSEHLNIILFGPTGLDEKTIIVNVTTKRSGSDMTTVLRKEDHSFIKHDSVVYYAKAAIIKVSVAERLFETRKRSLNNS